MNTMMALRRVSTPTTPMMNNTAEKKSASASIGGRPPSAQRDCADGGSEQQDTRDLERQEILAEQGAGDRRDHTAIFDLSLEVAGRYLRLHVGASEREDLRQQGDADGRRNELPCPAARVGDVARMSQIEKHYDEQKDDHDRAGVHEDLNRTDELRVEHDIER